MKALVTGCAGFIGSSITDRLLKENYEVIGIDCLTDYYSKNIKIENIKSALTNSNFKFIEKNILDINNFPDVDYIFHEAAQAGVRSSWGKDFKIYTKMNIEATQHLLESYKNKPLKKFVYASSSSVYGNVNTPMIENMYLQPISPYGVSKLAAEHLCYLYDLNYNIPTISLRYFTVYGPKQRPDMGIYKFTKSILDGTNITIYGDGTQARDFTYIDDVVDANLKAAKSNIRKKVFNVGGGTTITINKLLRIIEDKCNKKSSISYENPQKGDVDNTSANTLSIKKHLDWSPNFYIDKGIQNFVEWYKENAINR